VETSLFCIRLRWVYERFHGNYLSKVTLIERRGEETAGRLWNISKVESGRASGSLKARKLVEGATDFEQRTRFDMENEFSSWATAKGCETTRANLSGRRAWQAPADMFDLSAKNALLIIENQHVSVPQVAPVLKVTVRV